MNKIFSFLAKNESHNFLRLCAKVFRAVHIVLAFATLLYMIIYGGILGDFGTFLGLFLAGIISFCFIMFMGMFIEALIIGLSNIVENQFEELVLKNKAVDQKDDYYLKKKQKANFEKLEKFNELRKSGAITEEEYEVKKKEHLEKM